MPIIPQERDPIKAAFLHWMLEIESILGGQNVNLLLDFIERNIQDFDVFDQRNTQYLLRIFGKRNFIEFDNSRDFLSGISLLLTPAEIADIIYDYKNQPLND